MESVAATIGETRQRRQYNVAGEASAQASSSACPRRSCGSRGDARGRWRSAGCGRFHGGRIAPLLCQFDRAALLGGWMVSVRWHSAQRCFGVHSASHSHSPMPHSSWTIAPALGLLPLVGMDQP
jgi:hypothetical protein